jgi:hypothetical protein
MKRNHPPQGFQGRKYAETALGSERIKSLAKASSCPETNAGVEPRPQWRGSPILCLTEGHRRGWRYGVSECHRARLVSMGIDRGVHGGLDHLRCLSPFARFSPGGFDSGRRLHCDVRDDGIAGRLPPSGESDRVAVVRYRVGFAIGTLVLNYEQYALLVDPSSLPGGRAMAWVGLWFWPVALSPANSRCLSSFR